VHWRVAQGACPNLLAEAPLYRYDPDSRSEDPEKQNDHALDASAMSSASSIGRRRPPEDLPPAAAVPNSPLSPGTLPACRGDISKWSEAAIYQVLIGDHSALVPHFHPEIAI
jgi:hypothetical protein